jgi:hypothetical protein
VQQSRAGDSEELRCSSPVPFGVAQGKRDVSPLGGIEGIGLGRQCRRECLTQGRQVQIGQSEIEHQKVKSGRAERFDCGDAIGDRKDAVTCPAERSQETFSDLGVATNEQEM